MNFLKKRFWKLRLRTWLIMLALLPVLAWGTANLILATPYGTGFVERQVTRQLGLTCRIDQISWSPWAGVRVREVDLVSPAGGAEARPLMTISEITMDPAWSEILAGRRRWERLEFGRIEMNLSLEAVRKALSAGPEPGKPGLPAEGGQDRRLASGGKSGEEEAEATGLDGGEDGAGGPSGGPRVTGEEPAGVEPVDDFEGVVVFSEVNLRLYSEALPDFSLALAGLRGEIPVWGRERQGQLTLDRLALGERLVEESLSFPVTWSDRKVELENWEAKIFGIDLEVSATVRLAPGLPAGLMVECPEQHLDLTRLFIHQQSPLEVGGLESVSLLKGYLLAPSTVRGSSLTRFRDVVIRDLADGGETRFDRGRVLLNLSSSGLLLEDLRAVGDEDAVLMNGFATAGGEAAATVRVVSSPDRAESHRKRVERTADHLAMEFEPLVTPDREYHDIRVELRGGVLMMDLGVEREWVPFFPVMGAILGRENYELPRIK